jgi:hypothetical protein
MDCEQWPDSGRMAPAWIPSQHLSPADGNTISRPALRFPQAPAGNDRELTIPVDHSAWMIPLNASLERFP